jgi:SAM-dependent methyltransferase
MRLNMGCGTKKFPGWINVDKFATSATDQVFDLEKFPWPWPDDCVDEVAMHHVLEHLGAETSVYLGIIKELYRVCRDGAKIVIAVPHPRHDTFFGDPTHVRPIVPEGLLLFSQAANRETLAAGRAHTPLGLYIGVDFEIQTTNFKLEEPWGEQLEKKMITVAELQRAIRTYNNVVRQIEITMSPVKPAGRTSSPELKIAQAVEASTTGDHLAEAEA